MRSFLIVLFALASSLSFAQWQMPARQIIVNTSNWYFLAPDTPDVQSVFDFIDGTNVFYGFMRGTNKVPSAFSNNQWYVDFSGLLPGAQGDQKADKFERLMRPLRISGSTELTIANHAILRD